MGDEPSPSSLLTYVRTNFLACGTDGTGVEPSPSSLLTYVRTNFLACGTDGTGVEPSSSSWTCEEDARRAIMPKKEMKHAFEHGATHVSPALWIRYTGVASGV